MNLSFLFEKKPGTNFQMESILVVWFCSYWKLLEIHSNSVKIFDWSNKNSRIFVNKNRSQTERINILYIFYDLRAEEHVSNRTSWLHSNEVGSFPIRSHMSFFWCWLLAFLFFIENKQRWIYFSYEYKIHLVVILLWMVQLLSMPIITMWTKAWYDRIKWIDHFLIHPWICSLFFIFSPQYDSCRKNIIRSEFDHLEYRKIGDRSCHALVSIIGPVKFPRMSERLELSENVLAGWSPIIIIAYARSNSVINIVDKF